MREDGRLSNQMRPLRITPNFTKHSDGSVLIELGDTKVICTVNVEDGVPPFLRNAVPAKGWLTAEYSMLPGSTDRRSRRERPNLSGRTQEIQRLIGRALRGIINLQQCPDMTFIVDCDVIQADGGTRTAAITGGFVALKIAVDKLLRAKRLQVNPLYESVAAVSVGLINDNVAVDLNYLEDSGADLDMNVVMNSSGKFLEVQGTGEKAAFDQEQINQILTAAKDSLSLVFDLQLVAADGQVAES